MVLHILWHVPIFMPVFYLGCRIRIHAGTFTFTFPIEISVRKAFPRAPFPSKENQPCGRKRSTPFLRKHPQDFPKASFLHSRSLSLDALASRTPCFVVSSVVKTLINRFHLGCRLFTLSALRSDS